MGQRLNAMFFSLSAAMLVALMFIGSLVMWVGIPVGWLWVGSQVKAMTNSLGNAILVMAAGAALSIYIMIKLLSYINGKHSAIRTAAGRELKGLTPLEIILVTTGAIAMAVFGIWFVGFSGTSPVPLKIGI